MNEKTKIEKNNKIKEKRTINSLKNILVYTYIKKDNIGDKLWQCQKKYSNLTKDEIKFIKKKLGIIKVQDIDVAILKEFKGVLNN